MSDSDSLKRLPSKWMASGDQGSKQAIVSSGYSHDPVMSEFEKYGFKAVIVKPYQVEELKDVVLKTLQ